MLAVTYSHEKTARIITTGKNSILFWILNGDALKKRVGVFGKQHKPKFITTVAFDAKGTTITGDSDGNVLIWKKGTTLFILHLTIQLQSSLQRYIDRFMCFIFDNLSHYSSRQWSVFIYLTHLNVSDGTEVQRVVANAHGGSVFYILALKTGGFLTTGKDLHIKQWDAGFEPIAKETKVMYVLWWVNQIYTTFLTFIFAFKHCYYRCCL